MSEPREEPGSVDLRGDLGCVFGLFALVGMAVTAAVTAYVIVNLGAAAIDSIVRLAALAWELLP